MHIITKEFVVADILPCGRCHCWLSVPQLTLWPFPESAGGTEAGRPAPWSLKSSWRTRVRAHCWDTYSGNTSNPRNSTRSAGLAWYRIAYSLQMWIFLVPEFLICFCLLLFLIPAGKTTLWADWLQQSGGCRLRTGIISKYYQTDIRPVNCSNYGVVYDVFQLSGLSVSSHI